MMSEESIKHMKEVFEKLLCGIEKNFRVKKTWKNKQKIPSEMDREIIANIKHDVFLLNLILKDEDGMGRNEVSSMSPNGSTKEKMG
jgi:hypothetical protein